ncbi:MAG TPA: lysophospholipid acyltransferase family protein [Bacteroidales bacterium]|nr:lysophospholipid acyltransferase family protein [Bacteroidales bacterium]HPS15989.1 lysophospholipid acyltransferase family protein [Bacteroidales bacterium]
MNFFSKIFSYLLFGLLLLFSLLPFWLLYILSDALAFILYGVLKYRKKVVYKNLAGSLNPDIDINKTAKKFYRFLADVFLESIKCFTIRKKNLLKRITCDNPEIMEQYAKENRSVIFMSAHYGNWEYLIYAMNIFFPHLAIGVGKPLTNQVMNKLTNDRRSRFGMKIINALNIKEEFAKDKDTLTASLFLSDQYPGGKNKGFPKIFLNKETEFLYGAEKYAKDYNYPVVYADVERLKRGRYKIHLIKITDEPKQTAYGEIMNSYISLLEKTIQRAPEYWLWSHKRWKHIDGFYN